MGLVRRDAVAERPPGAAGRVGAQVERFVAAVGSELFLALGEAVGAVRVDGDLPLDGLVRHVRSVDGDVAACGRLGVAAQISGAAVRIDGGDGLAAVRVEEQHDVAVLRRVDQLIDAVLRLDVLPRLLGLLGLDRISKGDLGAVGHAVLRGLDREGGVGVDGHGRGVRLILAGGLIIDGRALRRAGEGDGRALGDLARGGSGRRRCDGFRNRVGAAALDFVERKLGGIAGRSAAHSGGLVGTELAAGALVAGKDDGVGALTAEGERSAGAGGAPVVAAGDDAVVVAALRRDGCAVGVRQRDGAVAVDGDRPDRTRCVRRRDGHCGDPS